MKYLLLFTALLLFSCIDRDAEEFKKNCPYDLKYSGHWLRVPITISPHKKTYDIGDTIIISTIFSDSIVDIGTQQTFKIQDFPFKPLSLLYRFVDGMEGHDAGYRRNKLFIDSIYEPHYSYSNIYTDGFRCYTIYENGMYKFEIQLILKAKGKYILLFTDLYQNYLASGDGDYNAEADAITFEGKCPGLQYYICSMIEGDDYLRYFERELTYLDEKVYRGTLRSIRDENPLKFLGYGATTVEFDGFFGFEVIE